MAWEISMSAAGWEQVRAELEEFTPEELVAAITDDLFETVLDKAGEKHAERAAKAEGKRLEGLPQDVLVDRAFNLIEKNNLCDNGGWAVWIDREGYHKVWLPEFVGD